MDDRLMDSFLREETDRLSAEFGDDKYLHDAVLLFRHALHGIERQPVPVESTDDVNRLGLEIGHARERRDWISIIRRAEASRVHG